MDTPIIVLLQGCAAPSFLVSSGATATTARWPTPNFKTVTILKTGVDTAPSS